MLLNKLKKYLKIIFAYFGYEVILKMDVEQLTYCKESFSQCGEDRIIDYIFKLRDIQKPSYLDIGANHPFSFSNTALFYLNGSRGINIEANPNLIGAFQKYRPLDENLNVGIGISNKDLDFYIMEDEMLSTFSQDEAKKMGNFGKKIKEIQKIAVLPISEIIKTYYFEKSPDLMSIDVEGLDQSILNDIDFEIFSPKVICVEAAEYSPIGSGKRKNEIIDFLVFKGYYEHSNTNLNAIMVKRDFWFVDE